ncbi:MAG: YicC/YloC family endoribonuclease [Pseudomonadota bacterium]
MIVSMTAYGRAENSSKLGRASCEIRSVNHRYLELTVRLPEEYRSLEQSIRECIGNKLKRGKVDCTIRLELNTVIDDTLPLNEALLGKLIETSEATSKKLQNPAAINALDLLRWPGILEHSSPDIDIISREIQTLVNSALQAVVDNRQREGEKIQAMILERTLQVKEIVKNVQNRMPEIIEAQREKYKLKAQELVAEFDHDRLEQEILVLTQKIDVAEEMDRLNAHVEEVDHALNQTGPVGRRLDFLMQELNREANTLGSKSAHIDTSNASVDLKVLIEQMREQIQNIE